MVIKNYLYTIGTYLSSSQRDEVLNEIESNLYDYLEENFGEKEYSLVEIEKAIRAMGHPQKVAEAYMNTPRCLIGPTYIDTYWLIIKISVLGAAIGLMVSNILSFHDTQGILQLMTKTLASIWNSSLSVVGSITLIFAGISYYAGEDINKIDDNWSLRILSEAPKPDDNVSIVEVMVEMFSVSLGLVVINHSSSVLGIITSNIGVIPIINMEYFSQYIIWLNPLLGSTLVLNAYLLIKRQWYQATRMIAIALNAIWIIIFSLMALTPNIVDYTILSEVFKKDSIDTIHGLQTGIYIGVAIIIIMCIIDTYTHLKVLLKRKKM